MAWGNTFWRPSNAFVGAELTFAAGQAGVHLVTAIRPKWEGSIVWWFDLQWYGCFQK